MRDSTPSSTGSPYNEATLPYPKRKIRAALAAAFVLFDADTANRCGGMLVILASYQPELTPSLHHGRLMQALFKATQCNDTSTAAALGGKIGASLETPEYKAASRETAEARVIVDVLTRIRHTMREQA